MNNKPILVLQFRTDASLKHEREQIMLKGGYRAKDMKVVNILDKRYKIPNPKDLNKYEAVITAASGQFNVSDWPEDIRSRIELLIPFFKEIVRKDFPTLSICFGHHVFANLNGGFAGRDANQSETGTFKVHLTKEGKESRIFNGIPKDFWAVLGHKDCVMKLPRNAKHLAYSKNCKYQAYQIKNNIYSVQFHPELDRKGLIWRLMLYPDYMKNKTLKDLKKEFKPIPNAKKVISNFRMIVKENNLHKNTST